MPERRELVIARLGAQGDGVADSPEGPIYVPYTLPGERIIADIDGTRGRLVDVLDVSAQRVRPPCRHFASCGGCAVQHLSDAAYDDWKRAHVSAAFRARAIEAPVAHIVTCAGKRRRAALSARKTKSGVFLGFHEAGSHELVDLQECMVLHEGIVASFPVLRELVGPLLSRRGEIRVTVTWTQGGLDAALDDIAAKLDAELRTHIARVGGAARLARVSVNGDPVYEGLQPILRLGAAEVVAPPGVFLQAVAEAEGTMIDIMTASLSKAKRVGDLFCGVGAFTFALAAKARVLAVDSDKAAILALQAAARNASGLKPIDARVRDLFREPLSATELNEFDGIVFDPPRAGAEAQARMLAKSKVKTIVAVSCNPATLARDARHLLDGGYRLESVTPIDQFKFSPHVEVVAVVCR